MVNDRHIHLLPCHQDTDLHCKHTSAAGIDYPTAHGIHVHTTESTHKQTSTQQSTFFSATPLSHSDKGAAGHQKCLDTRPDQPLGLPAPAEQLSPACSSQLPWPRQAPVPSQGDAPQNLPGFIPYLPASPGMPKGGGGHLEPEPLPLRPNYSNKDPTLTFPWCDHQYRLKWEATGSFPTAASAWTCGHYCQVQSEGQ